MSLIPLFLLTLKLASRTKQAFASATKQLNIPVRRRLGDSKGKEEREKEKEREKELAGRSAEWGNGETPFSSSTDNELSSVNTQEMVRNPKVGPNSVCNPFSFLIPISLLFLISFYRLGPVLTLVPWTC